MSESDFSSKIAEILRWGVRRPEEEPVLPPEQWGLEVIDHLPEQSEPEIIIAPSPEEPSGQSVADGDPGDSEAEDKNPESWLSAAEPEAADIGSAGRQPPRRPARIRSPRRESPGQLIGLDIGSSAIRAVRLSAGRPETIHQIPLAPGIIVNGLVQDSEQLSSAVRQLWKQAGIRSKKVNIGLKNRSLMLRVQETAATEAKDIRQVIALSSRRLFAPIDPRKLVVDYSDLLPAGDKRRLLVAAADRQLTGDIVRAVEKAGLKPLSCEISALAAQRALRSPRYPQGLHLVIDIGAETSSLLFCSGPDAYYLRIIEIGGNDFTAILADKYNLSWDQSEESKRQLNLLQPGNDLEVIDLADRLINEIEKTVQGAEKSTGRELQSWSAIGGGSRLPGLTERIAKFSTLPLEMDLQQHPQIHNRGLQLYAPVIGLASRQEMSLLPPKERRRGGLARSGRKPKVQFSQSVRQGKKMALGDSFFATVDPRLPALGLALVIALGTWLLANNSKNTGQELQAQIASSKERVALNAGSWGPVIYDNSPEASAISEIIAKRPARQSAEQSMATIQQAGIKNISIKINGAKIIINGRPGPKSDLAALQQNLTAIPGISATEVFEQGAKVKIIINANNFKTEQEQP
jgi:type IV pilus assembly protein PilM